MARTTLVTARSETYVASMAVDRGTGARVVYLDNLKWFLIAGVIVSHAATAYGAIGAWFDVEPSLSPLTKAVFSVGDKAGWLRAMGSSRRSALGRHRFLRRR